MRTQEVYVESPTLTGQEFKLSEQEFQELFSNLKRAFESVCFAQSELAKVLREQEKQAVELEQLKSLILGGYLPPLCVTSCFGILSKTT